MNGFCRLCGVYAALDDTGACDQCARAEQAASTLGHRPRTLDLGQLTVIVDDDVELHLNGRSGTIRLDERQWKRLRDLLDSIPPKAVRA